MSNLSDYLPRTNDTLDSVTSRGATTTNAVTVGELNSTGEVLRQGANAASIGINQTWQDVTASRALNVDYTNTTGRPIMVSIRAEHASAALLYLAVDGLSLEWQQAGGTRNSVSTIVPPGSTYKAFAQFATVTIISWHELR